jgi:hypothetical protein
MAAYMQQGPLVWLVDNMTNCDDMMMNAVVANATGAPPVAVDIEVYRHDTWHSETAMCDTPPPRAKDAHAQSYPHMRMRCR